MTGPVARAVRFDATADVKCCMWRTSRCRRLARRGGGAGSCRRINPARPAFGAGHARGVPGHVSVRRGQRPAGVVTAVDRCQRVLGRRRSFGFSFRRSSHAPHRRPGGSTDPQTCPVELGVAGSLYVSVRRRTPPSARSRRNRRDRRRIGSRGRSQPRRPIVGTAQGGGACIAGQTTLTGCANMASPDRLRDGLAKRLREAAPIASTLSSTCSAGLRPARRGSRRSARPDRHIISFQKRAKSARRPRAAASVDAGGARRDRRSGRHRRRRFRRSGHLPVGPGRDAYEELEKRHTTAKSFCCQRVAVIGCQRPTIDRLLCAGAASTRLASAKRKVGSVVRVGMRSALNLLSLAEPHARTPFQNR